MKKIFTLMLLLVTMNLFTSCDGRYIIYDDYYSPSYLYAEPYYYHGLGWRDYIRIEPRPHVTPQPRVQPRGSVRPQGGSQPRSGGMQPQGGGSRPSAQPRSGGGRR